MATMPMSDRLMREALDLVREHGTLSAAARAVNLPRTTLQLRYYRALDAFGLDDARGEGHAKTRADILEATPKPFEQDDLPDELPTAVELLERRRKEFSRKKSAHDARHLIPIRVTCDGPIGVALLGDPHVDDPGTDISLLERHVAIINRTDGLFAGNVGDFSNNWVGRLARLYGQQSTSAAEAWVLVEWLIKSVRWIFLVGGNHDCWSGDGDPIQWMAKSARVQYEAHGMRLGLTLPNGRVIRLNARHDFSGKSMWNPAHGPSRAAQMGWRDHVLVCGHTHVSGHNVLRDPMNGLISHSLRVGSYKTFDRFAEERGLPNQTFMVAPVVIVRPQFDDDDNRLITVCYDPETGADFLTWLRKRKTEKVA